MTQEPQSISVQALIFIANGPVIKNRAIGFGGKQVNTKGQKVIGVTMESADHEETFPVIFHGTAIIETGGSVRAGASIITDKDGRAIERDDWIKCGREGSCYKPDFVFADALQSADSSGEFIKVMLRR